MSRRSVHEGTAARGGPCRRATAPCRTGLHAPRPSRGFAAVPGDAIAAADRRWLRL
ncbi:MULTISPECIES: hypothetical protein [Streptomyces]|uniref:Uncharacterized protein n=1 Tax=Streptomyces changanensis TaxID=2964669 RepID=A0ABY5N474_9ACTN|nr:MULTISPECIES: hypothetical protein [Streptomyces]UUS30401.1 hypothetical protein NRO40_05875 [Streptomyces changanensis]